MNLIDKMKEELKGNKKKILLPEGNSYEIKEAAKNLVKEGLVDIVILGEKDDNYPMLDWINPNDLELDYYIEKLYNLRKDKGLTKEEAESLIKNNYMYLACLMLLDKKVDGIVSGKTHSTSDTLRPALQIIKGKTNLVSSFFIMDTNLGIYLFSDCGLIQSPDNIELSQIGTQTINSYLELIGNNPKVAYLSHSTYNSSKHSMVDKVKEATNLAIESNPTVLIDGPLQLDAAIIPDVAKFKSPNSPIAGEANILIFPDIDSGNIGYKLVERFGASKAYGPLIQGLNYPVNDLSRGSSIEDIEGVIIITALQAIKNMI